MDRSKRALLFCYWHYLLCKQQEEEDVDDDVPHKIPSSIFIMAPSEPTEAAKEATDPPPTAQPAQGRKKGVGNYGRVETKYMLDAMEKIVPIGPEEWNRVMEEHDELYPGKRTVDSIRRRFMNLHRKSAPTGSPNMPDDVRQAKKIKRLIGNKSQLGDGEDEFDLAHGYADDPDAPDEYPLPDDIPLGQPEAPTQPTQEDTQPTQESLTQLVSITPSKRTYGRSGTITAEFLQSYQLQLQQDRLQWERDREERREERLEAKEKAEREFQERREERAQANKKSDDMMAMMMAMLAGNNKTAVQPPVKRRKLGLNSIAIAESK